MTESAGAQRPPSVDALRSLATTGLPHPILVEIAREAIAAGDVESAGDRARAVERALLVPVVNATGVVLHTNLGRAPFGFHQPAAAHTVEFDLATGERGSRQAALGRLVGSLVGAESALAVNNNAAAVLLVVAALGAGRDVVVSRGESVEIGGSFRIPDVMEQSGARLVDVGTTNRTRLDDYRRAIARPGADVAVVLKVHPSNYRIDGFVEDTSVAELATLGVPVVADIGSGLIDATCPWLAGRPPSWLAGEPAARQTLDAGAALVTFSGDKLLGGPQAGIIAGRADLVDACARHPSPVRSAPGGSVLAALQSTMLSYLRRSVVEDIPFWSMVATPIDDLRRRADAIVDRVRHAHPSAAATAMDAVPGAGSAPGATMASFGVVIDGDLAAALRAEEPPIIARVQDGCTFLDLRSVFPSDDHHVVDALVAVAVAVAP